MTGAESGQLPEAGKLFELGAYAGTPLHNGNTFTMPLEIMKLLTAWWNEKNVDPDTPETLSWRME